MRKKNVLKGWTRIVVVACGLLATLATFHVASAAENRPNVLWIYIEDQNPWFSNYGHELVHTPNMDALARAGVQFERAYAAVPVCSPSRSALITGCYPIRLGTHDQRSSRTAEFEIHLPSGLRTVPEIFREAGYATFNRGKDDYNFIYDREELYSVGGVIDDHGWKGPVGGGDWRDVPEGVPFFGQYQWSGGKHASGNGLAARLEMIGAKPIDPASVKVPPQYPDIPEIRTAIADHLGTMLMTDHEVGELVARLKEDGLWDNTIIFLFSDHGSALPRGKEFCYAEGLHVPLLVVAPGMTGTVRPGTHRSDLAALLDVSATSLALAGLEVPEYMDARNLFSSDYKREYVFSSADRMSNTIDHVRSVMGERYHYIRNFMTDRPLLQWGHREMLNFPEFVKTREMFDREELTAVQAAPYGPRPTEELYDLEKDPHEVTNLAATLKYEKQLEKMRGALEEWIADTDDKGQYPRSDAALREVLERYPEDWLRGPEFQGR